MSSELLKRIGEFIYGDGWQAPLARDLGVNERSMRRWVAGTDEIPRGVWRDLDSKLETWHRALGSLLAEVKHTSGLVEVHSFEVWDQRAGDMVRPPRKSTAARIAKYGGEVVPGSSEWVPSTSVDVDGRVKEAKAQKTAAELAALIAARLGIGPMFVSVNKDPAYGWHPTVYGSPSDAYRNQLLAEQVAQELRAQYELSE